MGLFGNLRNTFPITVVRGSRQFFPAVSPGFVALLCELLLLCDLRVDQLAVEVGPPDLDCRGLLIPVEDDYIASLARDQPLSPPENR